MKKTLSMLVLALLFACPSIALDKDSITGKWYSEGKRSVVEIVNNKDIFTGKVVSIIEPLYPKGDVNEGKEKMDTLNPDKNKRTQLIVGLEFLKNFKYESNGKWSGGSIYNPDDGKTYFCTMTLQKDGSLLVRGSIDAWGLLGKTQIWLRAEE